MDPYIPLLAHSKKIKAKSIIVFCHCEFLIIVNYHFFLLITILWRVVP